MIAALVLYILVASAVFVWFLTPRRSSVKLLLDLEGDAEPFQAQVKNLVVIELRISARHMIPIAGFEAVRIYYALEGGAMRIIRILHGKRDAKRILQSAEP